MKILQHLLVLIFGLTTSSVMQAQGVPKAYEAFDYSGTVNGKPIRFRLADGYIEASYVQMYLTGKAKPIYFRPDAGTVDEHSKLKFVPVPESKPGYFILNNMQEAYDAIPSHITGYYFLNGKKIPVRFELTKLHKR